MSRPYTVHLEPKGGRVRRYEVWGPAGPDCPLCGGCSYYGARKIADALNATRDAR